MPVRLLPTFARSETGNISLMFAAGVGFTMLSLGVAVDLGRTLSTRSDAQNALDTVALAKAVNPSMSAGDVTAMFNRNFSSRGATVSSVSAAADSSGVVSASASVSVPTSFAGLLGKNAITVSVTSQANPSAPPKYSSVTMTTLAGSGAFDKEIYAVTLDKNGTVLTRQLALSYNYNLSGGVGTKTYSPVIGSSITLSISSYDQFAIEMVVYEDTSYTGKKINPKTLRSNATNASTFIKSTGACTDTLGETQNWEDGGDSNYKDFIATMKCTLVPNSSDNLRISG